MDGETCGIKCDVELNVTGPSEKTVGKWTADALRLLADQDAFGDGHHAVKDGSGSRPEIYLDNWAEG